jgi:hypothetical protein
MLFFIYLQGDPGHGQITSRVSRLPGQLKGELPDAVPVVIPDDYRGQGCCPLSSLERQLGQDRAQVILMAGMVAPAATALKVSLASTAQRSARWRAW